MVVKFTTEACDRSSSQIVAVSSKLEKLGEKEEEEEEETGEGGGDGLAVLTLLPLSVAEPDREIIGKQPD